MKYDRKLLVSSLEAKLVKIEAAIKNHPIKPVPVFDYKKLRADHIRDLKAWLVDVEAKWVCDAEHHSPRGTPLVNWPWFNARDSKLEELKASKAIIEQILKMLKFVADDKISFNNKFEFEQIFRYLD